MPYKKKYATDAERKLALAAAGKRGAEKTRALGHFRGGRKKGGHNKNSPAIAEPVRSVQMRESAYKIFVKLAGIAGETLVGFMSKVAEALKAKNAKHFTNEPPVQM